MLKSPLALTLSSSRPRLDCGTRYSTKRKQDGSKSLVVEAPMPGNDGGPREGAPRTNSHSPWGASNHGPGEWRGL